MATVAQISGEALTVAQESDTPSVELYTCNYSKANGMDGVGVLGMDAAAGYDAILQANGAGAKPISGLGDKAFSATIGVETLFGNVSITVSNLQTDAPAVQIIKTLQPKL